MLRRAASSFFVGIAQALRLSQEASVEQAARCFSSIGAGHLHNQVYKSTICPTGGNSTSLSASHLPHLCRALSTDPGSEDSPPLPPASSVLSSFSGGGSASPYNVEQLLYAAQAGELDALSAASSESWILSRLFQRLLCIVHDTSQAPWWAAIAYTTLGARVLTLPLIVHQQRNTARMSLARPEMTKLKEWFDNEQMRGNEAAAAEYQERLATVWKKYDCNPFRSILGALAQAPLFIGFFSALRAMALAKVPSMTEGGIYWFTDLTVADPYYLLPIASSAVFLLTVELGAADGMQGQDAKLLARMKWIFRGLGIAMVPLTASMPQGVFCYWVTSNLFSLVQSVVFKVPGVRRALNLPLLSEMQATASGLPVEMPGKPIETFANPPAKPPKQKRARLKGQVAGKQA